LRYSGSAAQKEEIQAEINILKRCRSPNIVNYYGSYINNNDLMIMMDLCSAGSLRDAIETRQLPLTEDQVAYIMKETLQGLAYLHKCDIVHRDVKAANILLNERSEVKIGSFFGRLCRLLSRSLCLLTLESVLLNAADFGVSDQIHSTIMPGGYVGTVRIGPLLLSCSPAPSALLMEIIIIIRLVYYSLFGWLLSY
jgi:serine/threonine protein kinase